MKSNQMNKLGKKKLVLFLLLLLLFLTFFFLFIAEKKCYNFIKNNLRAPPIPLVKKWGTKMGLSPQETASVNDRLLIRHQLGTKKKHYFPSSLLKKHFYRSRFRSAQQHKKTSKSHTTIIFISLFIARRYRIYSLQKKAIWTIFLCNKYLFKICLCNSYTKFKSFHIG